MRNSVIRTIYCAAVASAAMAACSTSPSGTNSPGGSGAPAAVANVGKVVFCSDITNPPAESYQGTTPVGYDIEIGQAIAKKWGVQADFANTQFSAIIPALNSNKCDAILSAMTDTEERAKQVTFVDYLQVGLTPMVPKGNPQQINSFDDLSGKSVGVELGSYAAHTLEEQNAKLEAAGKAPVEIVTFPGVTGAVQALGAGKTDAFLENLDIAEAFVKDHGDEYQLAYTGNTVGDKPMGIALRKNDIEMQQAVKQAVDGLYADGTIPGILKNYDLPGLAIKK